MRVGKIPEYGVPRVGRRPKDWIHLAEVADGGKAKGKRNVSGAVVVAHEEVGAHAEPGEFGKAVQDKCPMGDRVHLTCDFLDHIVLSGTSRNDECRSSCGVDTLSGFGEGLGCPSLVRPWADRRKQDFVGHVQLIPDLMR